MPQPRFRIPYGKKFVMPSIPIREKPPVTHVPSVSLPPVPKSHVPQISSSDVGPVKRPIWISAEDIGPIRPLTSPSMVVVRPSRYEMRSVPPVIIPPSPRSYVPDISEEEVGPVGPPAHVSLREIGPVGPEPDLPDWLIEEARLKAPDIRFSAMPRDVVMEGRYGVNVKPQPSDYRAPPVTTPKEIISMRDVSPAPSEEFILAQIQGEYRPTERPTGIGDRELELRDLNLDLLRGTSRYAAGIGVSQGRTLGEGI